MTIPTLDPIPPGLLGAARTAAAWMLTYALHSTLLLGAAWLLSRRLGTRRLGLQEGVWKTALLGGLVTASLQLALAAGPAIPGLGGFEPLAGRWNLGGPGPGTVSTAVAPAPGDPAAATAVAGTADPVDDPAGARRPAADPAGEAPLRVAAGGSATPPPASRSGVAGAPDPLGQAGAVRAAVVPTAGPRGSVAPGWPVAAVAAWLLVGGGLLLTLALSYAHLAWRLRHRRAVGDGAMPALFGRLLERALEPGPGNPARRRRAAGRRLARARLTRSSWLPVPIAWGLARPEVSVPDRAVDHLSPYHQESILAHELSHLVRRDPAWLAVARGMEAVLFFQPLHRLARRRLQEIAEYRCDDHAAALTGRPLELARCLTEVAAWRLAGALPVPTLPAPGMASDGSGLGRRVRRLLERRTDAGDDRGPRGLAAGAAAVLLLVVLVAPAVTGQGTPAEPTATSGPGSAPDAALAPAPGSAPLIALPALPSPTRLAGDLHPGEDGPRSVAPAPGPNATAVARIPVVSDPPPGSGSPSARGAGDGSPDPVDVDVDVDELRRRERELRREVEALRRELEEVRRQHAAALAQRERTAEEMTVHREVLREQQRMQEDVLRRELERMRIEAELRHPELERLRREDRERRALLQQELERAQREALRHLEAQGAGHREALEEVRRELETAKRRALERAELESLQGRLAAGAGPDSAEILRRELEARREALRAERERLDARTAAEAELTAAETEAAAMAREVEAHRAEMERTAEALRRAAEEAVAAGRMDEAERLAADADHLARRAGQVEAELTRTFERRHELEERALAEQERVLDDLERRLEERLDAAEAESAEGAGDAAGPESPPEP